MIFLKRASEETGRVEILDKAEFLNPEGYPYKWSVFFNNFNVTMIIHGTNFMFLSNHNLKLGSHGKKYNNYSEYIKCAGEMFLNV